MGLYSGKTARTCNLLTERKHSTITPWLMSVVISRTVEGAVYSPNGALIIVAWGTLAARDAAIAQFQVDMVSAITHLFWV